MQIKKLIIYNFRSYYGMKVFNFSEGLNLILGSNGDGKTTFFDALSWVLNPSIELKKESVVSAKMFKELKPGQIGRVLVSLEFSNEYNNTYSSRIIERSLSVSKTADGNMRQDSHDHAAFVATGGKKGKKLPTVMGVLRGEQAFPPVIKKYHIFKGEDELNIFNNESALHDLVNLYADIKDVPFYQKFAKFAIDEATASKEGSVAKTNATREKINSLNRDIHDLESQLERTQSRLEKADDEYEEYERKIEKYKDDIPAIKRIIELQRLIEEYKKDSKGFERSIDENYSFKLLDDKWILMGFESILNEYNRKVQSFSLSKKTIEEEDKRKQRDEYDKQKAANAKTELEKIVWKMNDVDKMKYMLKSHRCAFCGTDATEGSDAYNFIKQRLNDVIELLTARPEDKNFRYQPLFYFNNIDELLQIGKDITDHNSRQCISINEIPDLIKKQRENNDWARAEMHESEHEREEAENEIVQLNANSKSGLDLVAEAKNASDIDLWRDNKEITGNLKKDLELEINRLTEEIEKKKSTLKTQMKKTGADLLYKYYEFFSKLQLAVANASDSTYGDIISVITEKANEYLSLINVDDFTGVVKFEEKNKALKLKLVDKNDKEILDPNTSLLTTAHISVLFAISEITKKHRTVDYPLIFDAPTSSFDEGKDKSFYECLNSKVNKQCIVVTKSYLYKDAETNDYVVDEAALSKLNCRKYRIRKLSDFDKQDITTIDTQIEEF